MKHLNDIKGFIGLIKNDGNAFKVTVQNEHFWIRDCNYKDGLWYGVVDNELLMTENHGLEFGDTVSFELMAGAEL